MLQSFQIVLLATLAASFLYWAAPVAFVRAKRALLLGVSALLIFVSSPKALLLALLATLFAHGLFALRRRLPRPERFGWLPWLVFAPLVVAPLVPPARIFPFLVGNPAGPIAEAPALLGLSFYSIKLYGSLREGIRQGALGFGAVLTDVLFFPSFAAGPIDVASAFDDRALARDVDLQLYLRGLLRIGVGAAKLLLLSTYVSGRLLPEWTGLPAAGAVPWADTPARAAYAFALLKFVALYLNFAGYTDIAVGSGWLFNLRLSENFRSPLLAHSIQSFWQRWHLSLAGFITKHLYLPLVRATGRPVLSIVAAFALIGLWHQVTWNYLLWGVGHGAAMGVFMRVAGEKRKAKLPLTSRRVALRAAGLVFTVSYVSVLSTFANLPSFGEGLSFLAALFGAGGIAR